MNNNEYEQKAYDWNDELTDSGDDLFAPLPEGDYLFSVTKVTRARFNGSEKIPPCPKAVVSFRVTTPDGKQATTVTENFLLCSSLRWKLEQLFKSVGMLAKDGSVKMDWLGIIGKNGVCGLEIHNYTDKNGQQRQCNRISHLYPSYEQPPIQIPQQAPQKASWKEGQF